jgi:hypothetical protein
MFRLVLAIFLTLICSQTVAANDSSAAETPVVLRIKSDSGNFDDLSKVRIRILLSEVDETGNKLAPFQATPKNAIDVQVREGAEFARKDGWLFFTLKAKPGNYVVSFIYWGFAGSETAVVYSGGYVPESTLRYAVKPDVVNYLGDFSVKYEATGDGARKVLAQLGFEDGSVRSALAGSSLQSMQLVDVAATEATIACATGLKKLFSESDGCPEAISNAMAAKEFPFFKCPTAQLNGHKDVCFAKGLF